MSIELVEGKVYLRDTRNGNIHPYEELLSQMQYMKPFIAGSEAEREPQPTFNISLTGLERAKEWDRLAQMTEEERRKELNGKPAPWERQDHLNAADVVAAPADAPQPRKPPSAAQPAPQAPALTPAAPEGASAAEAQTAPVPPTQEPAKKSYKLSDKAAPHSYADLKAAGWTNEALIEQGYLVEA